MADLVLSIDPALVDSRTRSADCSAKHIGKLFEHLEAFGALKTTAAGNNDVGLRQIDALGNRAHDVLKHTCGCNGRSRERADAGGAALFGLRGLEGLRTNGRDGERGSICRRDALDDLAGIRQARKDRLSVECHIDDIGDERSREFLCQSRSNRARESAVGKKQHGGILLRSQLSQRSAHLSRASRCIAAEL